MKKLRHCHPMYINAYKIMQALSSKQVMENLCHGSPYHAIPNPTVDFLYWC